MKWLRTLVDEAFSLFVDDRQLVLDALIAVVAAALVVRFGGAPALAGGVLVIGLVASLALSVWLRSGRKD